MTGFSPEVWAAMTASIVYGSVWAIVPTVVFELVERTELSARRKVQLGTVLLLSNVVVSGLCLGVALRHPLIGLTALVLFKTPLAWLSVYLPRMEWLVFPVWSVARSLPRFASPSVWSGPASLCGVLCPTR